MNTISLCMIVRDEEQVLKRCLKSVKECVDEIIIVDTGSNDNTIKIATEFTDKIYNYKWCDDFSKARNFAFSKGTSDYLMWLDADDIVPKSTAEFILELKQNMIHDTYMFKYDIAFLNGKASFSFYRERIVKNSKIAKWEGCVHECITPFGKVLRVDKSIEHRKIKTSKSDRNINIYEKIKKERELSSREEYYYSRELFDHNRIDECIISLEKFVTRKDAWIENKIDAYYLLALSYYKLGDDENALASLFKTFNFDKPRANICCLIGDYFLNKKSYATAIFWYELAVKGEDVTSKGGFVESKYYNYYPYLQLCVCYFNLKDYSKSYKYNEKASKYLNDEKIQKNREIILKYLSKN